MRKPARPKIIMVEMVETSIFSSLSKMLQSTGWLKIFGGYRLHNQSQFYYSGPRVDKCSIRIGS